MQECVSSNVATGMDLNLEAHVISLHGRLRMVRALMRTCGRSGAPLVLEDVEEGLGCDGQAREQAAD
jgi:hypothetical protein